ncbi:hypothetical protein N7474_008463 [Penicillium riverlandense]|uniref:uncharacterized protein n=1 Tax=Penicillium riverlandense TaxID=1903569 RepID=UPI0025477449|nr:uncharacterized protein N7474_008463 [Penicillium riverlandense]KAJ5812162.1 hypothetical protein N7474_008463 [Penicillium riverlandense]
MSSSTHSRDGNGKPFSASLSSSNGASSKKTSFNLQSSKRNRPTDSPAPGSRSLPRRPHQLGHGGDSSDEDDSAPVHEEISGFDTHTGGVLTADGKAVKKDNEPLVIPVTSRNNWRDRPGVNTKKSKKNLLPREVQAMQEAERNGQAPGGSAVETEGPSMAFGLSFAAQKSAEGGGGDPAVEDQAMPDAKPILPPPIEESKPLTDDQKALRALISESKGEAPERRTDLVIESQRKAQEDEEEHGRYDEASSFRTDVASRPDSATLDAYDSIPVEEFGAALLRGMGWKDGQAIGRGQYGTSATADRDRANKLRVPERRPGFLGIGAKDTSGGKGAEAELGAWGKSAMRKASRKQGEADANGGNTEGVYMPVMMRNRKTGEHITEEELAAMQKEAKSKPTTEDDWRDRRDRNLEKSGRDKDRDRGYRRRDYDDEEEERHGRRNGSSRRDRSLSSSRHSSSRRSRYDDDGGREDRSRRDRDRRRDRDDDRDRRRDSGNDRDRDRERDRDRDTDRSHRHGDDRSSKSRRDRDRDRDRDSRRSRRDD